MGEKPHALAIYWWAMRGHGHLLIARDHQLLLILAGYHNRHTGDAFPSRARLSREMMCAPSTANEAVARLKAHGLIELVPLKGRSWPFRLIIDQPDAARQTCAQCKASWATLNRGRGEKQLELRWP